MIYNVYLSLFFQLFKNNTNKKYIINGDITITTISKPLNIGFQYLRNSGYKIWFKKKWSSNRPIIANIKKNTTGHAPFELNQLSMSLKNFFINTYFFHSIIFIILFKAYKVYLSYEKNLII